MKLDKLIISLALVSSFFLFVSLISPVRKTKFNVNNENIRKRYKFRNSVSIEAASSISILIPMIFFALCFRCTNIEFEQEIQFYVCFLTCHLAVSAVVENIKNIVGRLRPDFIQRCRPVMNRCTGNKKVVSDGRKSFPSGHSSVTSCGFIFMVYFVNSKFIRQLDNKFITDPIGRSVISLLFLIIPISVGLSRYFDNRHFISDILAGFFFGTVGSILFFRYFAEKFLRNNIEY